MSGIVEFLKARLDEDEARPDHSPERVLREVTAKRAIMSEHELEDYEGVPSCWLCAHVYSWGKEPDRGPCATFRALAAVYADHPDYRDEWRP